MTNVTHIASNFFTWFARTAVLVETQFVATFEKSAHTIVAAVVIVASLRIDKIDFTNFRTQQAINLVFWIARLFLFVEGIAVGA